MTVSTGCFPLIDVVLSGSDPQKGRTFALLIAHRSAKPREVFVSSSYLGFHLRFIGPLPSCIHYLLCLDCCTHRSAAWDFCLTRVYLCSPQSRASKTGASARVSRERLRSLDKNNKSVAERGRLDAIQCLPWGQMKSLS